MKSHPQKNTLTLPLVSIITVVYNGEDVLERTVQSILSQEYSSVEYIVIDGSSKDRTTDIIKKYADKISFWVSEPDKGIYDAMNKGIQAATGEYLWFINAGDEIYAKDTLRKIFEHNGTIADVYYGETAITDKHGNQTGMRRLKAPKRLTWKSFQMGMLVSHQSIIVKKNAAPFYSYNYRYCNDIDWVISILKKSRTIVNTNMILSKFQEGGYSKRTKIQSLKERFAVMLKHYGLFSALWHHFMITLRFVFSSCTNNK